MRISSCLRVPIDDHALIIVYSIPVKFPKSKGLQGQQSSAVYFGWFIQLLVLWGRFPAQEYISGASKIPTVIYYDQSGKVRAVGAEATKESIYAVAEDENWAKVEW